MSSSAAACMGMSKIESAKSGKNCCGLKFHCKLAPEAVSMKNGAKETIPSKTNSKAANQKKRPHLKRGAAVNIGRNFLRWTNTR